MLEDGGQGHQRLASQPAREDPGVRHAKLSPTGQDLRPDGHRGAALAHLHREPFVLVEALEPGSVISGELELVPPLQLQDDVSGRFGDAARTVGEVRQPGHTGEQRRGEERGHSQREDEASVGCQGSTDRSKTAAGKPAA